MPRRGNTGTKSSHTGSFGSLDALGNARSATADTSEMSPNTRRHVCLLVQGEFEALAASSCLLRTNDHSRR